MLCTKFCLKAAYCVKIFIPFTPKIPAESGWSFFCFSNLIASRVFWATSEGVSAALSAYAEIICEFTLENSAICFLSSASWCLTTSIACSGSFSINLAAISAACFSFSDYCYSCSFLVTSLASATVASNFSFYCFLANSIDLLIKSSCFFFSLSSSSCLSTSAVSASILAFCLARASSFSYLSLSNLVTAIKLAMASSCCFFYLSYSFFWASSLATLSAAALA